MRLTLFLLFYVGCLNAQLPNWHTEVKSDLELIGPVKSVVIKPYLIKPKGRLGVKTIKVLDLENVLSDENCKISFTKSGNFLEGTYTQQKFKPVNSYPELEIKKIKCEYDANENLIYSIIYDSFPTISAYDIIDSIFYYENGKPLKSLIYDFYGLLSADFWTYNSNGDIATTKRIYRNEVRYENLYEYDSSANRLIIHEKINGKEFDHVMSYNKEGQLISSSFYYPDLKLTKNENRIYYASGGLKEKTIKEVYGDTLNHGEPPILSEKVILIHYEYDELGNQTLYENVDFVGNVKEREVWEYNSLGLLVKYVKYSSYIHSDFFETSAINFRYNAQNQCVERMSDAMQEGFLIVDLIKYEYDSHGNWILKSSYKDEKLQSVVEREITYY